MEKTETRLVSEITWRKDLYPRFEPIPAKIQEYAEAVELVPPIEVNQHNELIDGYHRWTAHKKMKLEQIKVKVTKTESDADLLALAYERNAHGVIAISAEERRHGAIRMYADGTGKTEEEIARLLHVKVSTVNGYLARAKRESKARRNKRIWDAWLACDTLDEIAEREDLKQQSITTILENHRKSDTVQKSVIFSHYQNPDWNPPIYDIWKAASKSNETSIFGNTEARWTDNLLYMYTQPFDIVVDPFGGGGSTIDVCKKRLRRYWVSDRLPIEERLDMRQWDILDGPPPLHKRWGDVALMYLDPPYWKQAEGKYSEDANDLANMSLDDFYTVLTQFIQDCAGKMHTGAHIALIIQPTQWKAPDRQVVDHVIDIITRLQDVALRYIRRISCPYSTQQYTPQMVDWAKENRDVLVLTREIIIWQVGKKAK